MPKNTAQQLFKLIKSDPINLEKFYQQTFPGLDSYGNDNKGIKRIKTSTIYLIDIQKVKQISEGDAQNLGDINKLNKILEESTKLELPQEIGILDSF